MWSVLSVVALADPPFPPPRGCTHPGGAGVALAGARRPVTDGFVSVTSDVRPLRLWFDPAHANSAEIAPRALETLERAWDVQVDQIGFRPPVLPDAADGPEFDVYLVEYQPFAAFVSADGYDTDPALGDGYNAASAFMVVDRELPMQAVPSYLSHEFNHVLQYATDFSEPTLPLWEGTATAAQEWTVAEEGYWSYDVPSFQEIPWAPALVGDSYTIFYATGLGYTYEYGAALWVRMLDEKRGDGAGSGGAALWEAAANEGFGGEPDVVDAFGEVWGGSVADGLNELALVRFLTGDDWDPRGLSDAGDWKPKSAVPAAPLTASDLGAPFVPDPAPAITGQVFVDVDLTEGELPPGADRWLVVTASSATGLESALMVAWWDDAGGVGDTRATGAVPMVELPLDGLARVVVAVTNLGPPGWDGDLDPYAEGDQVLDFVVEDRAAPPTDTATPPPPAPDGPPASEAEPSGCGCDSAPVGFPWVVPLVSHLFRTRSARRAPRRDTLSPGGCRWRCFR